METKENPDMRSEKKELRYAHVFFQVDHSAFIILN